MNFIITIYGELPEGIANRLWRQVEWAGVNLTVLDKHAYIYGDCDDRTINQLAVEAGRTGHYVEVERG
jgi:hypothetical protein